MWLNTYMKEMCRRFPHYKYELCHNLYLHLWLWLLHVPLSLSVVMEIEVCQSPDTVSITQGTPYTHRLHIQHISLVPAVHKAVINSAWLPYSSKFQLIDLEHSGILMED